MVQNEHPSLAGAEIFSSLHRTAMTALSPAEVPPLDAGMVNVTDNVEFKMQSAELENGGETDKDVRATGYRVQLPVNNAEFRIAIPYNPALLPPGFTEDDIQTYVYDRQFHRWMAIERDSVNEVELLVYSRFSRNPLVRSNNMYPSDVETFHETSLQTPTMNITDFMQQMGEGGGDSPLDFINAVLKTPEMPETSAYTPTSIKELKAADPLEGLTLMQPPTANNSGTANLSYPIEIPAGRQGMQPNLALTYSSSGGNGWLGVGWDISIPSITVETRWGVPRYDQEMESEVYVYEGEQLVTFDSVANKFREMPHRTNHWTSRSVLDLDSVEQFYPRKNEVFDSIVRHGTGPGNYWWTVTHKNGVTDYYGKYASDGGVNNNCVLRAGADNTHGPIAHWALAESVDPFGNSVKYYYNIVEDAGVNVSPVQGRQIYIYQIQYTNSPWEQGKYIVNFKRYNKRDDGIISANRGLKEMTMAVLDNVEVLYDNQTIRTYYFHTTNSRNSNYKTRLEDLFVVFGQCSLPYIEDPDKDKRTNYSFVETDSVLPCPSVRYSFEYFDYPNDNALLSDTVQINTLPNDNIQYKCVKNTFKSTALGATKGKSWSLGGTGAAGLGPDIATTLVTLGANTTYSNSKNEGLLTLVDIDGDGLADKVFKKNGKIYYRKHIHIDEQTFSYGEAVEIAGATDFLKETGNSVSIGVQASAVVSASANVPLNWTTTTNYFADVNGDGLVDLVTDRGVLFNTCRNGESPSFSPVNEIATSIPGVSGGDAVYISTQSDSSSCGGIIFDGVVNPDIACQYEYEDILVPMCALDEYLANSCYVIIGYRIEDTVANGNMSPRTTEDADSAIVRNICKREVVCTPETLNPDMDAVKVWVAPYKGNITVFSNIQLERDSSESRLQSYYVDGVRYSIEHNSGCELCNGVICASDSNCTADTIGPNSYNPKRDTLEFTVRKNDLLFFRLQSQNDRSFDKVNWTQNIEYTFFEDTVAGYDRYELENWSYDSQSEFVLTGNSEFQAPKTGTVMIAGELNAENFNDSVKICIKVNSMTVDSIILNPNVSYHNYPFNKQLDVDSLDKISLEIRKTNNGSPNPLWANIHYHPILSYYAVNHPGDAFAMYDTLTCYPQVHLCISHGSEDPIRKHYRKLFGELYRGWGQFAYNNHDSLGVRTNCIDIGKLLLPKIYTYSSPEQITYEDTMMYYSDTLVDSTNIQGSISTALETSLYSPMSTISRWVEMTAYGRDNEYRGIGLNTAVSAFGLDNTPPVVYIPVSDSVPGAVDYSGTGVDLEQIQIYDHPVPTSVPGAQVQNIRKRHRTKSEDKSFSVDLIVASFGLSSSIGSNFIQSDYMDLNGDGYPDPVATGGVQYTMPWGGIGSLKPLTLFSGDHLSASEVYSDGNTFGRCYPTPNRLPGNNSKSNKMTISAGGTTSESHVSSQDVNDYMLIDVNGDGLPDLVDADKYKTVRLNNGYGFLGGEIWNIGFIRNGESSTDGNSIGGDFAISQNAIDAASESSYSVAQVSISGGTSQNQTCNRTTHQLMDINGDGLPDKVELFNNGVLVSYNLGNGEWSPQDSIINVQISKSLSYNEDVNIGVTGGFTACAVLKINIGVQTSPKNHSFNTDCTQLVDVNGDGYPDYVTSDKESRMNIRYNTAGKTNLLRKVVNFTGSTIELSYAHSRPCFEQPHRSWNLVSVETHNNVTNCPVGGNHTLTTFEYGKPHYDRYERIGFGYDTVISVEHNTENNDTVYRKTIIGYNNTSFFKRGRKTTETVLDEQNRPFVEIIYDAKLFDLDSIQVSDSTCEVAGIYVGHEAEITNYYSYEGDSTAMLTTAISKVYDSKRNVTKYTFEGILNAHFNEWFSAEIEYAQGMPHNMISQPERIKVYDHNDTLMRREAVYSHTTGKLTKLLVFRSSHDASAYDFTYDTLGNMDTILMPQNDSGQRVMMVYLYDNDVHTYPSKVKNVSLGYFSTATYDLRFGKPTVTSDINGNKISYEYDTLGRTVKITAPYELDNNIPYTIRMTYFPCNFKRVRIENLLGNPYSYACTYHYDSEHPYDDIRTTLIKDGLGRLLQTKKDIEINGHEKSQVTGKIVYDCFGRILRQYYPFEEDTSLYRKYSTYFDPNSATVTEYDILDRQTRITQPYGCTTKMEYSIDSIGSSKCFVSHTIDAMGKTSTVKSGALGQQLRHIMPGGVETIFEYDALGRLTKSIDPDSIPTNYEYDKAGQMIHRRHPDAKNDYYVYDHAGNMIRHINALNDTIKYRYHFSQLTNVEYPRYPANNVHYRYGTVTDTNINAVGKVILQEDGSGFQTFKYGKLGEVTENIRTFALPYESHTYTFKMQYEYDSWNRMQSMTYPDGEVVHYDYNRGGMLKRVTGNKNGVSSDYIRDIRYNKFELKTSVVYGNSTRNVYEYDSLFRLSHLRSYKLHDTLMQDITYTYDSVGNILQISNSAATLSNGLGGTYTNIYTYDDLYRLSEALCRGTQVTMSYHANGRIHRKTVKRPDEIHGRNSFIVTPFEYLYNTLQSNIVNEIRSYTYTSNPHENVTIDGKRYNFLWDSCGNMTAHSNPCGDFARTMIWTEDNRLQCVADNSYLSLYLYDAGGERTYKLTGDYHLQNTSGLWFENYTLTNPTLYASPYLVATQRGYTKHYYAETERIASKIGGGGFSNLDPNVGHHHANSAWDGTMGQMRDGHRLLPSFPSDLLAGLYDWLDIVQPESDVYFYHPDHLGSSSWITDANGEAVQHLEYLPWGEDLIDQKLSGFNGVRYTFSAKEKDSETGLSYFGSRYYSSDLSVWLSVDPMASKYPSLSPYVYCANNPVKLADPDGRWIPGLDEDNNIIVTREEGDDINSFKKFMGSAYSDEEINNMYGQMSQDGSINLTKTYGREFQIMTDAINDAYNDPDFENSENYNCWGAAIAVSKCIKIQGAGPDDFEGVGYHLNSLEDFDNCLSNGYLQGGQESASVGKTVLRFGNNVEEKSHGAVYMGTDRNGTEYVFTKNGWVKRPEVSTTERMLFENGYGGNCDRLGNAGQGYYNRKNRRR